LKKGEKKESNDGGDGGYMLATMLQKKLLQIYEKDLATKVGGCTQSQITLRRYHFIFRLKYLEKQTWELGPLSIHEFIKEWDYTTDFIHHMFL